MALTVEQIEIIRDELTDSTPPTDDDLQALIERSDIAGSITTLVVKVLRKRLNDLIHGGPLDFNVAGEYSENRTANIKALTEQITRISTTGLAGEEPTAGIITFSNVGRRYGR